MTKSAILNLHIALMDAKINPINLADKKLHLNITQIFWKIFGQKTKIAKV